MPDWLLTATFISIPLGISIAATSILQIWRSKSKDAAVTFYNLEIGGSRISISKSGIFGIAIWILPYWAITYILPLPYIDVFLFLSLIAYVIIQGQKTKVDIGASSNEIVSSLQNMKTELGRVTEHVERLALDIRTREQEIFESTKLRDTLLSEIDTNMKEADEWRNLTENQKKMIIDATKQAVNRKGYIQSVLIFSGSILINLIASVIWSLMGQPGADKIQSFFSLIDKFTS